MYNINVSLNKTLADSLKTRLKQAGYSNISEYIRDLLRHDLRLAHNEENYPYDYEYIEKIAKEGQEDYKAGRCKKLTTLDDLLA